MKPHANQKMIYGGGVLGAALLLFLVIAGCVISPRRLVNESPSPTPTPDVSPTPTATPTPTPAAVMGATVPRSMNANEFVFLGDAAHPVITGFKIDPDGLLSRIAGSPFMISGSVQSLESAQNMLIVKTENGNAAFIVDRKTGILQQTNALAATSPSAGASSRPAQDGALSAALDASGKFMYVINRDKAELHGYSVTSGRLTELAAPYPISQGVSSIAVVKP